MKTGIELIAEERQEQLTKHGRTVEQDILLNEKGQLLEAAIALLQESGGPVTKFIVPHDWDPSLWLGMSCKPYVERLITAAALIAAEIDRLQGIEMND